MSESSFEQEQTVLRSVILPNDQFCIYTGGNFKLEPDAETAKGAFIAFYGTDHLERETIESSKQVKLPLTPTIFVEKAVPGFSEHNVVIDMQGKGRMAFLLQWRKEQEFRTVSHIVEIPADFSEFDQHAPAAESANESP